MNWLVTGGAGYIGAHIVRRLLESGRECVVLDDLSTGSRSRLPDTVPFVLGSILDGELVEETLRDHAVGGVLHLAGKKSAPESVLKPDLYEDVNVKGTQTVLNACKKRSVRAVVFSSTAAVYSGTLTTRSLTEDSALGPINPYGETKLLAEELLHEAASRGEVQVITFRYFNVAGADDWTLADTDGENLIPVLQRALDSGFSVPVFGTDLPTRDGTCIRDYVHVADIADAHLLAVESLERSKGTLPPAAVLNLGTGRGATVLEVIAAVEAADREGRRLHWYSAPSRPGDPVSSTCDASRAAEILGWRPRRSLAECASRAE